MTDKERIERLNQLADRLFCPTESTYAGRDYPPFDITQVNLHESKKEFIEELQTVAAIVDHLKAVLLALQISPEGANPSKDAMIGRIQVSVEKSIRQNVRKKKLKGASANDLVAQNFRDTGFFVNSQNLLSDMLFAYKQRLDELKDQENQFWTAANRAPNHFARTIALRFARLFARQTGKRPTFGTSRDGGHPSTAFGRALEEVFEVLGITASVRGVAVWAISQLKEEDWRPAAQVLGVMPRKTDPHVEQAIAPMIPKGR